MTMRLEQEPGRDDPRQQALAGVIARIRRLFKSDAPLPAVAIPEKPLEIKSFSPEQRKALEKQGFVIYALEALDSMHSEVAINPLKPFLPRSNNKTLAQQEEMVAKFSQELGKKVKGVKAIIGQAPDYVEIVDLIGHYNFEVCLPEEDDYVDSYIRTKTPTSSFDVACVSYLIMVDEHNIDSRPAGEGDDDVYVVPLVVPAGLN